MINIFLNKNTFLKSLLFNLIGILLLTSCENDLRDVNRIENIQKEEAVDISKHVRVVYSDSSIVKAELSGPEMRVYHDTTAQKNENREFPKGIQIIFFDKNTIESQRINSDYGIQKAKEGIVEFKKNVVIKMADGSIIKTEEIYYDQNKKIYYNHVPITFLMKDGRGDFQATSFVSDENFKKIDGQNITGYYVMKEGSLFPGVSN